MVNGTLRYYRQNWIVSQGKFENFMKDEKVVGVKISVVEFGPPHA